MKNPAWNDNGPNVPQGHRPGVTPAGPENKFDPGEPGHDGTTDVAWSSVAPIRFKRDEPLPTKFALGEVPD